jgi:ABC-type transport system involved in multi-copper enzyme maturation permease subunit
MIGRIRCIAFNTFREAVRDRVLYNLIVFALLLIGSSLVLGQISIGIEKIVLVNLGLTAISIFGVVIAIFIGIGLVSKEIDKKTLYTVLARPVKRWEFIVGKFAGLIGTLSVNAGLMALGFFAALLFEQHKFEQTDVYLLAALYFILLEFVIVTAVAVLFSSFSTPLFSTIFSFALFAVGTFGDDLRGFAATTHGLTKFALTAAAYLVPNLSTFNVISLVAHDQPVMGRLIALNTLYAVCYSTLVVTGAVLIFERRNLK